MKISFGTISITDTAKKLINKALDENKLTAGKLVVELERMFANFVGTKEAVAVSSGTDALIVALAALHDYGILSGKEVIVPALTFIATANAVIHAGFEPVFVDINRNTLNIDEYQIEKKINRAIGAILPVHLMGKPANMSVINAIGLKYGIAVIEDAAEAHGAKYYDKKVGSIGLAGCFSLYAAHIISSIEGGMITTDDSHFADICRSLRNHGRVCACEICVLKNSPDKCPRRFKQGYDSRFVFERIGYSAKMNELEAAIGIGSMEIVDQIIERRRENFFYLQKAFTKFDELYTISEEPHEVIGPHAFPIIVREHAKFTRDNLGIYLSENGIDHRTLFQSIPTQSKAYASYNFGFDNKENESFPNAEYVASNGLHIGIHQDIGKEECQYIVETIEKFLIGK